MFARARLAMAQASVKVLTYLLVVSLLAMSSCRYGYASKPTQCPTAPIQLIAATEHRADGSTITIMRAPKPGEKGFVCCHCAERRAAQARGWTFSPNTIGILPKPAVIDFPILAEGWSYFAPEPASPPLPVLLITHPPAA
jgi:hypothetical protein